MKLTDFRRLAWDTETTGVDVREDRIVTAALVVRGGGRPDRTFSHLINPKVPIPPEASAVHGVTDERAQAEGVDPKRALDEIAGHLAAALNYGMPVIAFNQAFDWSILHFDLVRHGLPTMAQRLHRRPLTLVDPHVLDRQFIPRVKGAGQRKLEPTCGRYGVELEDWHTAEADALAALLIAEAQFVRFPELETYGPAGLFEAQQAWRAEQQASLAAYFRSVPGKGHQADGVRGEWPLRPFEEAAS